jgi:hypothetical protein
LAIPQALKDDTKINLLVEATKSWVKMPMRHYDLPSIYPDDEARTPNTRTDITSPGRWRRLLASSRRTTISAASWRCWPTARAVTNC